MNKVQSAPWKHINPFPWKNLHPSCQMKIVCPCSALCLSPLKPSLVWFSHEPNFQACEHTDKCCCTHALSFRNLTHTRLIYFFIYLLIIFATNNNTDNMDSWTKYNTSPCNFRQQKAIAAVNAAEDKSLKAKNCHR